uniref:Uncharacterized protein n=1 Tax=Anguilla anguilla TaxID=7936 RepID=A0A0E9RIW9_ANGAN
MFIVVIPAKQCFSFETEGVSWCIYVITILSNSRLN